MTKITIATTKYGERINPNLHGQFVEFLGSGIYDGIWVGEDSTIPNYQGLRKDVVDALKAIKPSILRWPGGCFADTYHWRDGVGPRNQRPTYFNENFGTQQLENNHFGTHEFMFLCELVGAKPWFNINMLSGTVQESREWVEYVNRDTETSLVKERAKNGHSEPFNVEYWGIGNESWAGGGNYTAESYANEYRKYASAMPSFGHGLPWTETSQELKLIAVGPDGNKPKERVDWTKDFFKELTKYRKPKIDGYDLHFYNWNLTDETDTVTNFSLDAWYRVINGAFELEEVIWEQAQLIEDGLKAIPQEDGTFATDIKVDLIVGEWGNWHNIDLTAPSILWQQCTMRDAITTALTLDIFHRNCDKVQMACVAQSVNVLNSLFLTKDSETVLTPNYYVFKMYQPHQDGQKLDLGIITKKLGRKTEPGLQQIYSFASVKENLVTVNLVNISANDAEEVELIFDQKLLFKTGEVLAAEEMTDFNDFGQAEKITPEPAEDPKVKGNMVAINVPKASVSVYQFELVK
ncbi:alpha-N-arabinofuranosidase [Enterococcus sp. HY326]|uniref:alpha-N-arabinofuranosidase n=1 Tax=Enterococcus sp. HY326 TaxID=2971265 RepID=UPI00223FB448|nr:alpha-L-arabinofuranosidase C-terminal domain-containing protein [Enterococcus sp. HY326]